MQIGQTTRAIWRVAATGINQIHNLVIRFGIASLPANMLLNCDDVIFAALALSA